MGEVDATTGKTGRNEALKLEAGWYNTISAAFLIGAFYNRLWSWLSSRERSPLRKRARQLSF
jgi:hypothetical protein